MKSNIPIFVLVLFLYSIVGCAQYVVLNDDYSDYDFDDDELIIFPISKNALLINNTTDVKRCFTEDVRMAEEIIGDSLYNNLVVNAKSKFKKLSIFSINTITSGSYSVNDSTRYVKKEYNDDQNRQNLCWIPTFEYLKELGVEKRFILVLNYIQVGTDTVSRDKYYSTSLPVQFKYCIWDYIGNKMVLFGHREYSVPNGSFEFAVDITTWRKCFRSVSYQLINSLPFN